MARTAEDLIGRKFGKWTVIRRVEGGKGGKVKWECICDCGTIKSVSRSNLLSGESTQCKVCASNAQIKDLMGQRFGNLVVIDMAGRTKGRQVLWNCKCDCGNDTVVDICRLTSGNTKSCGCGTHLDFGTSAFKTVFNGYKRNAKARGYVFNLTKEEFGNLTKQNCHYCGVEPSNVFGKNGSYGTYIYNGIDRVDNNIGYLIDNLVPCCKVCNRAKHTMDSDDFKAWILRVADHINNNR